jgi:hypothetical protein
MSFGVAYGINRVCYYFYEQAYPAEKCRVTAYKSSYKNARNYFCSKYIIWCFLYELFTDLRHMSISDFAHQRFEYLKILMMPSVTLF